MNEIFQQQQQPIQMASDGAGRWKTESVHKNSKKQADLDTTHHQQEDEVERVKKAAYYKFYYDGKTHGANTATRRQRGWCFHE